MSWNIAFINLCSPKFLLIVNGEFLSVTTGPANPCDKSQLAYFYGIVKCVF